MVAMIGDPAVAGAGVEEFTAKSMPTPDSETVCVVPLVPPALSVKVSVAGPRLPAAPGVNVRLTTQFAPGATFDPLVQVVPVAAIAKSPALVPEIVGAAEKVSATPPELVTVTVCGALAVPTP